ncbi:MAG: exodeoxyribonuclease VII large subunit [bacterium]|nr:exodeoxyribonuclease VII large subunit [bacterium]
MTELALIETKYLSVSELTNLLRISVEAQFPSIPFEGEVSGLKKASSGHIYLTIKDQNSQIPAVIWKGSVKIDFDLEDGLSVYCYGKVTVYPAQGKLQVVIQKISPAGEGLLQKKFLALKKKLEIEGLFANERKRKIPYLPKAVGVVTSQTGAVIQDILVKIKERMPTIDIFLVPVKVQGKGSGDEIVEGIKLLNRSQLVDVIIVGRGGGSLEDLWAFNEEHVVKAIFGSTIPIVSAVGHETDISLSDLVADARAPTPTAAAELVVPKRYEVLARIDELFGRILDFKRRFEPFWQRLDEVEMRLTAGLKNIFHNKELMLQTAQAKIRSLEPANVIKILRGNIQNLINKISRSGFDRLSRVDKKLSDLSNRSQFVSERSIERRAAQLSNLSARLEGVNPKSVLRRGFSIVTFNGKVISNSSDLKKSDLVEMTFDIGRAEAEIKSLTK